MIRKIIIRTFFASAALFGLAVIAVATVAYMSFQVPEFYFELRAQNEPAEATQAEMKQIAFDFKRWTETSAARQRAQSSKSGRRISVDSHQETDLPVQDRHSVCVTEEQLNVLLADRHFNAGDVRNPRIRLLENQIQLGAEISLDSTTVVLSFVVTPAVAPNGRLNLDIISVHLGTLPIPLQTLASWVPADVDLSGSKMTLDLTGATPRLILNIDGRNKKSPTVQSVQCSAGVMTVDFQARSVEEHPAAKTARVVTQANRSPR